MKLLTIRRIAVLGLLLAACVPEQPPARAPQSATASAPVVGMRVERVIDGDTIVLQGISPRIRVWGLDAPERSQPGGPAATAAMRQLVAGQQLDCRQRDIDRYGRIVAQCFLPDGRDITAEMIRMGVATEYCYFSRNHYRTCR